MTKKPTYPPKGTRTTKGEREIRKGVRAALKDALKVNER